MGEVLLATDTHLGRDVAIKRMVIEPSGAATARFLREAKVQGRLDHPAIVPLYDLATDEQGRPFFIMKRLAGTTLADVLARRNPRFTRQKLLRAFADCCLAVEYAHEKGIIHRDLKPANIILGDFGEVYVLDWGIARVQGEADPGAIDPVDPETPGANELTQVGAILGTPGYLSPEILRGDALDHRADVFALGCILFEILAGEPLVPRTALRAPFCDAFDPHPASRAPSGDIPPELDGLCATAAALERDDRPTARQLAERIERFLDGDRDLAQRKKLALGHLDAARAAIATADTEATRALAMREAGRALALDPESGAAELLGRLMLEPPEHTPREVEARLHELDDRAARTKAHVFLPVYVLTTLAAPLLVAIGLAVGPGLIAYVFAGAINVIAATYGLKKKRPTTRLDLYLIAATNCVLIVVTSRVFGSILVAPGVAIMSMVMFASDRRIRIAPLAAMMILPVIVPWALELARVLPQTVTATGGRMSVQSEYFSIEMPSAGIAYAVYMLVAIGVSGFAARSLAIKERTALRAVELQAWHLRQIVRG
jgi:serine/threonine-protein kinase